MGRQVLQAVPIGKFSCRQQIRPAVCFREANTENVPDLQKRSKRLVGRQVLQAVPIGKFSCVTMLFDQLQSIEKAYLSPHSGRSQTEGESRMRVLLAGGGTAGHINPAIAIAQYIKSEEPDAEILFAGTPNGMEAGLVKKAGFAFTPIQISGFKRSFSPGAIVHNLNTLCHLVTSDFTARRIVREFRPDIVIGTGGYVSGPIVLAASKLGVKTAIHEQNAFPGVTNKILAKKVDCVFLAVEEAKPLLEVKGDCEVVGNPIRQNIILKTKREARQELGLDDKMCILSFGGSLGADIINRMGADLIEWNGTQRKVNHIHGYGRLGKELFPRLLRERGITLTSDFSVDAREYIDNMATCLAAADLVICRSGAITLSELEATGKASILVPSPYVAENHQYHNAMVLVNHEAAFLIEEKNYEKTKFLDMVEELWKNPQKLQKFGQNASKLGVLDTTKRIYDKIKILLNEQ